MNDKFEELHRKYGLRYIIVLGGLLVLGIVAFFLGQ